ncbi:MAG TPA: AsmA family protein [Bryobacteraceae bacterium]|nr:AsmA family protein [Bryobacteraceae bacterium]
MKALRRGVLIALLVVLAIGVIAPFLRADSFRPRIEAALEKALNRPVHIGAVHLDLFRGPGFSVDDVLIDDEPLAGIEPFAHVEHMQLRIGLWSLFAGKLGFSSIRLDTPSVNVVKTTAGSWNIQPLLDRRPSPGSARPAVPDIQIRTGRLNFKFGDTKSVFYIDNADVDIYPNESGDVVVRFTGSPARTDRGSQAFGEISARGLLHPVPGAESQLSMGLHLDRTAVSELVRLFNARDLGVHGYVLANAKLAGPISHIDVSGDLNISDVHRWDLMPSPDQGWTLNYRGYLNLNAHELQLETVAASAPAPPVAIRFRLADYLTAPKWAAGFTFHDLPAASLVETARHLGASLPADVMVDGKVQGGIGYSNQNGLEGRLTLENASMKLPRGGSAELDSAQVLVSAGKIALAPANITMKNGQSVEVQGEYTTGNSDAVFQLSTRQLTITETESEAGRLFEAAPIPLLPTLRQGSWKGRMEFEKSGDKPGVWSGTYDLQNAVVEIPGLAAPVHLASASVQMDGDAIQITRMRGHAGDVKFQGDYKYDAAGLRPERVHLSIPELQLAAIERLLLPTLRRNEGFLARTFRLRKEALPQWLQERKADVTIQVASLLSGDVPLGQLRAHAVWDGPAITVSNLDCQLNEMHATGTLSVDLSKGLPAYQLSGTVENLDYHSGQLDIDGELATSGLGADLLINLRSSGTFEGRDIVLAPDTEMRQISGSYGVMASSGLPRLLLTGVQVSQGADTLSGQGSSQPDGRIVLELASGRKQVRLTGMLLPANPDPAPAR